MSIKPQHIRIILGLKVKQLRLEQNLSFAELAKHTGMSVSYLNEIEKGKKFPKTDKITALAEGLGTSAEYLTSTQLTGSLSPLGDLLSSNFLSELPLDLFGIEISKVVEIIASAPKRVGAFISTLVELSRNYALGEQNFYFGALRSFLEMHDNYFEDLEKSTADFVKKHKITTHSAVPLVSLAKKLEREYDYNIVEDGLDRYPELDHIRSVFVPKSKELLLNSKLTDRQKAFTYGKELGFQYLGLKERANTSSLLKVNSFEEALSHFKAGYFSAALLINRETFVDDMGSFFKKKRWDGEAFINLLNKYNATPEILFQRLTNIIPQYFGLNSLFFMRFTHAPAKDAYIVDKELHLQHSHHPHGNGLREHYCRRWLSLSLLTDLFDMQSSGKYIGTIVGAQISKYHGTEDEYFCITLARPAYPTPDKNVSCTLGIRITPEVRAVINFLDDPSIIRREVNNTCERCPIQNCAERSSPPIEITRYERKKQVEVRLKELME